MDDTGKLFIFFIIVAIVALLFLAAKEEKKWDEFKIQHHCKVVAHIDGETFPTFGVGGNGQMTIGVGSTSDKTGWLCDDGIIYYK